MSTITVLSVLLGYAVVFAVTLLARLDYRAARRVNEWEAR